MLLDFNQIIAFICPNCANINVNHLNAFAFSGKKKICLNCNYGHNEKCVFIEEKRDKYKIDVLCPVCGENHSFFLKKSTFWNCKFISFKCPISGIDIYFHGTDENVAAALKEQEEMLSNYGTYDEPDNVSQDELLADDIIRYIDFLAYEGGIRCTCGNTDINIDIDRDSVILRCAECGRVKHIYFNQDSLQVLLNKNGIIIE